LPKLGVNYDKSKFKTLGELIIEKKTTHKLRPAFVIDNRYKKFLTKFLNKDELIKPKSQASIYQKGLKMTYCNPIPIAAACYLSKVVVNDGLNSIFNAVYDLLNLGKNITLKFGFCNIYFSDKNLTYNFSPEIQDRLNDVIDTQLKFKTSGKSVSQNWKTTAISKWAKSSLSSVLERPQTPLVKTIDNKNQMLKILSLDLVSSHKNKGKSNYDSIMSLKSSNMYRVNFDTNNNSNKG